MTYNDYTQHKDVLIASDGSHPTIPNPCPNPCTVNNHTIAVNPYYNQENKKTGLTGYSYLFTIPGAPSAGHGVETLLKVLDPLDQCYYDGGQPGGDGTASLPSGQLLPGGSVYVNDPGVKNSSGRYVYPKVTGPGGARVSNAFLDQCGQAGTYVTSGAGYSASYTNSDDYPTTLSFTLYNPVYNLTSDFTVAAASTTTTSSYVMQLGAPTTSIPATAAASSTTLGASYGVQPLYMGPEFTHDGCTQTDGTNALCTGAHAFKWFTLGAVTNNSTSPAYVMLVINSVANQATTPAYSGTYGTGGNVFALGICAKDSTDGTHIGNPADIGAWAAASLTSNASSAQSASGTEPARAAQPGVGLAGDGCLNPGSGYMVNARQAMCISTEQSGTDSFIPLANIPNVYTGNNVILKLFDPGDVSGADNYLGVLAPQDGGSMADSTVPIPLLPRTTSEPYQLDIAAPSGSGYSQCTYQRPAWWGGSPCGTGGSTDYHATDFQFGSGPIFPAGGATTTSLLQVATSGGDHKLANGTFMDFHIAVPIDYPTQTSTYGNSWWKMYYKLSGGSATDTTTWEILSNAAPVHLISQ
jgi:hypothetical protein